MIMPRQGVNKRGENMAPPGSGGGRGSHHAAVHSLLRGRRVVLSGRIRSPFGSRLLGRSSSPSAGRYQEAYEEVASSVGNGNSSIRRSSDEGEAMVEPIGASRVVPPAEVRRAQRPPNMSNGKRKRSLSRNVLARRGRSEQPRGSRYSDENRNYHHQPAAVIGHSLTPNPNSLTHEDGDLNGHGTTAPTTKNRTITQQDVNPSEDLASSSVPVPSFAGRPAETPQRPVKNESRSKKLWRVMRIGWKKNKGAARATRDSDQDSAQSSVRDGNSHLHEGNEILASTGVADISVQNDGAPVTTATTLFPPPTTSSFHSLDGSLKVEEVPHQSGEDDDDVPWAPTMNMLVQTGQLDRIESDSDEDRDGESSVNAGSDNVSSDSSEASRGNVFVSSDKCMRDEKGGSCDSRDSSHHIQGGSSNNSNNSKGFLSRADSSSKATKVDRGGHVYNLSDSDKTKSIGDSDKAKLIGGESGRTSRNSQASKNSRASKISGVAKVDFGGEAPVPIPLDADADSSASGSSGGHHRDDFTEMSGDQDSMNKFFDEVARQYMNIKKDNIVPTMVLRDDSSRADVSTLTKDETVYSGRTRKRNGNKNKSLLGKASGLMGLGESIARRGRSRGRKKGAEASDRKNGSEDASVVSAASDANRRHNASDSNVQSKSPRGMYPQRTRSTSLLRILLKSGNKTPQPEEEDPARPQRRAFSLDNRRSHEKFNDSKAKRDARSLPRKTSQTPDTQGLSLDDSHASLHDCRSSSLDQSDPSLKRSRPRRKTCLVCRRTIPRGEGIRRMDFHFCSGECFRCTFCDKRLSEEESVNGFHIMFNTRGSVLQCSKCTGSIMRGPPVKPAMPSLEEADETTEKGSVLESMQLESDAQSNSESDSESESESDSEPSSTDSSDSMPNSKLVSKSVNKLVSELERKPGVARQSCSVNTASGDHADCLSRAVRRLPEKASVTLGLVAPSGCSSDNKRLSALHFTQSDEDSYPLKKKLSSSEFDTLHDAKIIYELDSNVVGNPNYDGYSCSSINIDEGNEGPLRMKSLSMPKLESDKMDGAISEQLEVNFQWADDEKSSHGSFTGGNGGIRPERTGAAMLSIELFQSTMMKETVMKVLRQSWEYEENHVVHRFTFVVPFKKVYISWAISEGDELDLTQSRLEVTVRYDPPRTREGPIPKLFRGDSTFGTNVAVPIASTVHGSAANVRDDDVTAYSDQSIPNSVYVKTIYIDSPITVAGVPSSRILSNGDELDPDRDENDNFSELLSAASFVNSTIALPIIIYVRVDKPDFDVEVGLSLIEKNGATVVAEVSKSGLFANTQIREGCEILAINGQCVRGPRSVVRIMDDIAGKVLIMATGSPCPPGARFVVKKHNTTGFGSRDLQEDISFESVNGLVRVQDVAEHGVFAGSAISSGDICLSVDGVPAVSDGITNRALARSQDIVAMLVFSLPNFWKNLVEFTINKKYNRWWKKDSECTLLWGNEDCVPVTLLFDKSSGLCKARGNEEDDVDLSNMNIILDRVMKLFTESIRAYRTESKERAHSSSRSLSVSASGKIKNRSDVYRRALIRLDEMRENGMLSAADCEAGRHALTHAAIQTMT